MIAAIDHIVLTVASIEAALKFYTGCLGMTEVTFGDGRKALAFGRQKINLHQVGHEFSPNARRATPGSADLCFLASIPLAQAIQRLDDAGVSIEAGPVERTGAIGKLTSIYVRDPDGNLLEISEYRDRGPATREQSGRSTREQPLRLRHVLRRVDVKKRINRHGRPLRERNAVARRPCLDLVHPFAC